MRHLAVLLISVLWASAASADGFRLAVTTSFQNSGLADVLIPAAEAELGIEIDVIVVGTGQGLRLGQAGDVDAVLVHAPDAEKAFVAEGHAPYRRPIMYNTFVIVGPATDPASVVDQSTAADAFAAIAGAQAPFVSRGDESGTHQKELDLWSMAAIRPEGRWYRSVGAGMGAALNIAAGMDAYLLTDKASWLNFGNKAGLQLIFEGDPALFNQYAYLPIPAGQGGRDARQSADALEVWLVSARGQDLIDGFEIAGQAVFVANASQTVPAKSP